MFEMLLVVSAGCQDVVDVGKTKRQPTGDVVDDPRKCMGSVTKAKAHPDIFEQTKKCEDSCLPYARCLQVDLVVYDQITS